MSATPPPPETTQPPDATSEETTVGTGTFFAIGCTVAALLVILLGIAIFALFVD
ncbi:MAG: hypothetical protein ACRDJH_19020 [Thermomicrobiales bacterium]